MSPTSKAIGYPPAVARVTLLTEYFFLRTAEDAVATWIFKQQFARRVTRHRSLVPYPVFSLSSATLDEYLLEAAADGIVELNGSVSLTGSGRLRLQALTRRAHKLLRRS